MRERTTRVIHQICISDFSLLGFNSHCLSLQCGEDPRFLDNPCNGYLPSICRYSMNPAQGNFKLSSLLTVS